jgi:hypothetical protein
MKNYFKIILSAFLLFATVTVQSQVLISLLLGDKLNSERLEFGMEGGANFSHITNMYSGKYMNDWNLGFYFVYHIKNHWYANAGVLVKAKTGSGKLTHNDLAAIGSKFADTTMGEGTYSQKVNAFLVPLMMRYMFDNRFYVEGGIQASLRYKSWVEYKFKDKERYVKVREYNKSKLNPIDVGPTGGFGYHFPKRTGMTIGVKYYYGLVNAYKGMPGKKNSVFFVKANIPIGAGEKAQKKRAEAARKKAAKKAAK